MSRYAKAIVAAATVALASLAEALPEHAEKAQLAIAVLGALGVYLWPNKPAPPDPENRL